MRNELTKSIKYLEQDIAKDKLKVKKNKKQLVTSFKKNNFICLIYSKLIIDYIYSTD